MTTIGKSWISRRFALRTRVASACIAMMLAGYASPSAAATAEERAACTPDVFRSAAATLPRRAHRGA